MRQRVAILGATGSIGGQALDVISQHAEDFDVVALACGRQTSAAAALAAAYP